MDVYLLFAFFSFLLHFAYNREKKFSINRELLFYPNQPKSKKSLLSVIFIHNHFEEYAFCSPWSCNQMNKVYWLPSFIPLVIILYLQKLSKIILFIVIFEKSYHFLLSPICSNILELLVTPITIKKLAIKKINIIYT